jgi:hypothetical protein
MSEDNSTFPLTIDKFFEYLKSLDEGYFARARSGDSCPLAMMAKKEGHKSVLISKDFSFLGDKRYCNPPWASVFIGYIDDNRTALNKIGTGTAFNVTKKAAIKSLIKAKEACHTNTAP